MSKVDGIFEFSCIHNSTHSAEEKKIQTMACRFIMHCIRNGLREKYIKRVKWQGQTVELVVEAKDNFNFESKINYIF